MRIVYNTLVDDIIDANTRAASNNRVVNKIILTGAEWDQLKAETGCACCIKAAKNGIIGMIDGIPLEVL